MKTTEIIISEITANSDYIKKKVQRINQYLFYFRIHQIETMAVINLTEVQVKELMDWPLVFHAVEQSLRSICKTKVSQDQPTAVQPTRIFTPTEKGTLLCMPGFIGNYKLAANQPKVYNSLGCKLVTAFVGNKDLIPPKPNIIGNIFLFNEETGELTATIQASEITGWRTAGASLVATKYLFSKRPSTPQINTVAIIGCGVQGRTHAIGLLSTNFVETIRLWNRTKSRAESLIAELMQLRQSFKNPNIKIECVSTVEECAKNADVIVTATFSSSPILFRSMIKNNVHINAVGAGVNHHTELSEDIYKDPQTKIYVDSIDNAHSELKTLDAPIVGEVGDIINAHSAPPTTGITIFHSMGMAVEDVAVAQAILEKFKIK
ncbi:ketimine reductase mu-crystallin-like [Contarinia nasturtii]|uniref:ketimine reductase mu-crystallin-like n=1 Tax=Contarinia nasturtii TaxID=265458 RepID=UPI0012D397C6|nr:ketimine reductase mu-crystallin-like [Contarinia nasturtii]